VKLNKDTIISKISFLKNLSIDSNYAYSQRIKISREVLTLLQRIALYCNLPKPTRLEKVEVKTTSPDIKNLCSYCNSLVEITSKLSLPSEPLNEKWNKKWNIFLNELNAIEEILNK